MPAAAPSSFTLDKSNAVLALSTPFSDLFVHRYPPTTAVPPSLFSDGGDFVSVTRTGAELSIVAPRGAPEAAGMGSAAAEHKGGPWTAMRVKGPLEHRELQVARAVMGSSVMP